MPFKQWHDDEVLTAADANRYWVQQHWTNKESGESVSSSTVLQDDDHLSAPLLANTTYWLEFFIIYQTTETADLAIGWSVPSGTSMHWIHSGLRGGASDTIANISRTYFDATGQGWLGGSETDSSEDSVICPGEGVIITGGTPGTLQFRWAQNTSSSENSVVTSNSFLILQRITQ